MESSTADHSGCQTYEWARNACYGPADYEDEDNKRYCILHFPSKDKDDKFERAIQSKLEQNDYFFAGVYFPRDFGSFAETTFSERADFSNTTFSEWANFYKTTFSEWANFYKTTFSEWANFSRAIFSELANFYKTTFSERASFYKTTFSEWAYFSGATFSGVADFSEATFKERAAFYSLQTLPQTALVFSNTTIEKPERIAFHTMYLRPSWFVDVDAQKFDFSDVEWFKIPDADESNPNQLKSLTLEDEIENLVVVREGQPKDRTSWAEGSRTRNLRKLTKACRRLMNNAEENRDYPTANEMHYWSMEAQRKEGWSRLGLIATLYWALSGYGERPRRAFLVLVAIWLAFAALYLFLAPSSPFLVFSASNAWEVIDYSRQAVVYSLSTLARLNPRPPSEELDWFQTLVIIEGILGPVQIALLLLAVRRKVMR